MKGLARFTWWLTKWGMMLCVACAVVAVPYFYQRMDEEIRRRVEARLAQQYPDLGVSVRSAQLVEGQGIEIRGVSIREPRHVGTHDRDALSRPDVSHLQDRLAAVG